MKMLHVSARLIAFGVLLSACGEAPRVIQGAVVRYEPSSQILVMQDETKPGVTLRLSLVGAEVGGQTVPGDIVRVAYRDTGSGPVATRVMNVPRSSGGGTGAGQAH